MHNGRGLKPRVAAVEVAERSTTPSSQELTAPPEVAQSPLYGVAMLKIAMELKKADARPLEELVAGVLARMQLDPHAFQTFLDANGGLLRGIARRRGY